MFRCILIALSFLIIGCSNSSSVNPISPTFETIAFDVVEKQLVFGIDLPMNFKNSISQWFELKVKTNGFDGNMKFTLTKFNQEISSISDGKRVDISLFFNILLDKPSLSHTKLIEGNVASFGELTGDFSLAEFDTVIENTQSDLILRLSRDLKSKI